jgi:hypothetical protein
LVVVVGLVAQILHCSSRIYDSIEYWGSLPLGLEEQGTLAADEPSPKRNKKLITYNHTSKGTYLLSIIGCFRHGVGYEEGARRYSE